jgi:hypothetical protein
VGAIHKLPSTLNFSMSFFAKAKLRMPTPKINTLTVSIDPETLAWFRLNGDKSDRYMVDLKIYTDAQKSAATIL